ncbi:MAG: nucleoside recognition domain-containing protein [Clostridia bacterium]|nr:nucleoside recognition domain-containing protein [Clostridia bacterium]
MGIIWTIMLAVAVLFGCASGSAEAVGAAAAEGAQAAVSFCISVGGMICLWCAVMELMRQCGIAAALARLLRPVLGRLFPQSAKHPEIIEPLSANVSANLLGLGNAATPMGIQAAKGMAKLGRAGLASDELCRLVVLNTASIQLLPTTIAAIRGSYGAALPFDILPAVWISSVISVSVGLAAAKLFAGLSK